MRLLPNPGRPCYHQQGNGEGGVADRENPGGHTVVEDGIALWRRRAVDQFLWVGVTVTAVPLALVFTLAPEAVPVAYVFPSLAIYAVLVAIALVRRAPHVVRVWALVLVGYTFAAIALAATGLEGAGRLFLLSQPIVALVLLGPRAGYAASVLTVGLYAAAWPLRFPGARSAPSGDFYLLQGAMLVAVLLPLLLLAERFIHLLKETLAAEREASRGMVEAARERRRLELALLETTERERREVGHHLHDGPCQQITAALLRCKVAERSLSARGSKVEADHLRAIGDMLDTSVGEIHDLAKGLSPPQLAPGALAAALADLARGAAEGGEVACTFTHDGAAAAGAPAANQLFRVAQEAVRNALRHAGARRVGIELSSGPGALRLRVVDDGVGMPPESDRGGMGLRIMRHRAELMGGTLVISAAEGGGTSVTCTVPLLAQGPLPAVQP